MHTWSFSPDSKLIRFYKWCWAAKAEDLNFCKLFWGILFSPLAILLRYPAKLLIRFIGWIIDYNDGLEIDDDEGWEEFYKARAEWKVHKAERSNRFFNRALHSVSEFFSRHGHKIFLGAILIYVAYMVVQYVLAVIENPWNALLILLIPLGLLLGYVTVEIIEGGKFPRLKRTKRFLSDGYHSTKDKTCPIIVIEDDRKAAQHG